MSESKEFHESEECIALAKLERFLQTDMFAIRYMNEGEYETMMQNGIPGGVETRLKDEKCTFTGKKDLLSRQKKDWSTTIGWDTNWGSGMPNTDVDTANRIIKLMQKTHSTVDIKSGDIRTQFLLRFADALEPYNSLNPWSPITDMKEHSDEPIENFRKNPLSYDKNKLRQFLNEVSRMKSSVKDEMNAQYHMLAIFAPDAVALDSRSWEQEDWKMTKNNAKPDDLLAAFSILPQKDLYQDMINLSSNAGDLAHPIFDAHGVLMWPKTML